MVEHELTVPLTLQDAWLMVMGGGLRAMVEELDPADRERLRDLFSAEVDRRGLTEVDATTLIVTGTAL